VKEHPFTLITTPTLSISAYMANKMKEASEHGDILLASKWFIGLSGFYLLSTATAFSTTEKQSTVLQQTNHAFQNALPTSAKKGKLSQ